MLVRAVALAALLAAPPAHGVAVDQFKEDAEGIRGGAVPPALAGAVAAAATAAADADAEVSAHAREACFWLWLLSPFGRPVHGTSFCLQAALLAHVRCVAAAATAGVAPAPAAAAALAVIPAATAAAAEVAPAATVVAEAAAVAAVSARLLLPPALTYVVIVPPPLWSGHPREQAPH